MHHAEPWWRCVLPFAIGFALSFLPKPRWLTRWADATIDCWHAPHYVALGVAALGLIVNLGMCMCGIKEYWTVVLVTVALAFCIIEPWLRMPRSVQP